jgi:hypothetical protein
MKVDWDITLRNDQRANPVILVQKNVKGFEFTFDESKILKALTGKGHQLKTWGNAESTSEPHWIAVKKATPLHTDPRYPRYTWHLILYVDNFGLRGINKVETKLEAGDLILLDTHSPHQLFAYDKSATYYVACSIDSKYIMGKSEALNKILKYVNNTPIENNTERITK